MRRQRGRIGLMVAALIALVVSGAAAQDVDRNDISTERSSSILVFPKVIADGTRDTVIQITNTMNSIAYAHCFYVNGAPRDPLSGDFTPLWTEIDFDIMLTKQQPTYWDVATGRVQNDITGASDVPCSRQPPNYFCPNAGIDPGRIPPTLQDFTGELKCVQVDGSGAPLPQNSLKGEATLYTVDPCDIPTGETSGTCRSNGEPCEANYQCPHTTPDIAKYNAIGFWGFNDNDRDDVLCLGGEATDICPMGREYNACPQTWILNHLAENETDPVVYADSEFDSHVETSITVVPCTENFETQDATSVTVQFDVFNQFEQRLSASTTITCWAEVRLIDISSNVFSAESATSTPYMQTFLRPSNGTASRFLVVQDEVHVLDNVKTEDDGFPIFATAAVNAHFVPVADDDTHQDTITIPEGQGMQGPQ